MNKATRILLVEDDELTQIASSNLLSNISKPLIASSAVEATALLSENEIDLAFIDLDLEEELAGLSIIESLKNRSCYVVAISSREDDLAISKAYSLGAQDFLVKPLTQDGLNLVNKKFELNRKSNFIDNFFKNEYVTNDSSLKAIFSNINEILISTAPIILLGESGTGKSMIAYLIHTLMNSNTPFISMNCSEFSANLVESELFGHVKGAFTGADNNKRGRLSLADNGVLFLDEIATMPLSVQQKLLKAIEEKAFYPVGSDKPVHSNFRLISATCEDLKEKVKSGLFREDFLFRIDGYRITLPPLRERPGDIELLIKHFQKDIPRRVIFSQDAMAAMSIHNWPGNIRELKKVTEMLSAQSNGVVELEDLPFVAKRTLKALPSNNDEDQLSFAIENGLDSLIKSIKSSIARKVTDMNDGQVRKTLKDLKISSSSYYTIIGKEKKA